MKPLTAALAGLSPLWLSAPAHACAVCFRISDRQMIHAIFWGIMVMIGVTVLVLIALTVMVVRLIRRLPEKK